MNGDTDMKEDDVNIKIEQEVVEIVAEDGTLIETEIETEVETSEVSEEGPVYVRALPNGTAVVLNSGVNLQNQRQIYIIQTSDGSIPVEGGEVVVSDDMAVIETVSALEQLSRSGHQVVTLNGVDQTIEVVYEEVVVPENSELDVAEVEVGELRSSPQTIVVAKEVKRRKRKAASENSGEFNICRICNQIVPLSEIAAHHHSAHSASNELACSDCGKLFKSKRSLFGHKKEKHSGQVEDHTCPECGRKFGRKSNLKAHRESLHYGKKFPCQLCDRIFTNRSSMNQHMKKTHLAAGEGFLV